MSLQSSLYKADEIKVLNSLVVTVFSDFRNHLCCSSLYLFYFINVSSSKWGPNLHCMIECGRTRDLHNGRISSVFLYLKLREMKTSTRLAVSQLFSVCFCHLMYLVMIPRSRCWFVVGNRWLDMLQLSDVHHRTCINIEIRLALVCPCTHQVYWYLPVVPLCHPGL